jgi:hypothetical protein
MLMGLDICLGLRAHFKHLSRGQIHEVNRFGGEERGYVFAALFAAEPVRVKRVDGVGGHGTGFL